MNIIMALVGIMIGISGSLLVYEGLRDRRKHKSDSKVKNKLI